MKNKTNNFQFLSLRATIKNSHLSKNDVRKVKANLAKKMASAGLFIALAVMVISVFLIFMMGFETNWHHVEVYGLTSLLGQIFGVVFAGIGAILSFISMVSKKEHLKARLARIALISLYLALGLELFLFLYADAEKGYIANGPILSASITLISFLVLVQPAYWLDAFILDAIVTANLIVVPILSTVKFNAGGLHYYLIVAAVFPFMCYLIISILFFAECQKYCEELRNEILNNTALYDELTHCKNRHALKAFLSENAERWENKNVHLLLIMFDIDNFKYYNDQFSHPGGDYCLKTIAEAIRKAFPSPDLDFFRYGGEEFLLFFELEDARRATAIMQQVRNAVKETNIVAPEGAPKEMVTISVGGTLVETEKIFSFDESLKTVDSYLYKAKNSGKDACVYNGSLIN